MPKSPDLTPQPYTGRYASEVNTSYLEFHEQPGSCQYLNTVLGKLDGAKTMANRDNRPDEEGTLDSIQFEVVEVHRQKHRGQHDNDCILFSQGRQQN